MTSTERSYLRAIAWAVLAIAAHYMASHDTAYSFYKKAYNEMMGYLG